jgi:hypothetical protein
MVEKCRHCSEAYGAGLIQCPTCSGVEILRDDFHENPQNYKWMIRRGKFFRTPIVIDPDAPTSENESND